MQLHHASSRHYDFRLEVDGTLKSWAIPKGPSLRSGERRLAVEVEDHPLSYARFEGDIPAGNYGAGHVQLFDRGTWSSEGDASEALSEGKLDFELHGSKLKGGWKLIRTRNPGKQSQWLLLKRNDDFASGLEADDLVDAAAVAVPRRANRHRAELKAVNPAKVGSGPRRPSRKPKPDWLRRASLVPGAIHSDYPVPFTPQLTSLRKAAPEGDDWLHEIKWDGYRLLAERDGDRVVLRTRNGLEWTDKFPGVAAALRAMPVDNVRLDGELVALDAKGRSDFARLQGALKSRDTTSLRYLVFDMPGIAGVDLSKSTLIARKELLHDLLGNDDTGVLAFSKHIVGNGGKVFEASKSQGVEGIVSKRLDAPYVQARSTTWVKVKHEDSDEFVIVGYTPPKGGRSSFGSLLMARREKGALRYVGRVGTGYDDATLRELLKKLSALSQKEPNVELPTHTTLRPRDVRWVKPRLVAEVAFRGWGGEGLLRQAAFKRLREDKSLADLQTAEKQDVEASTEGVKITHPERVVFPSAGFTKGEVADYYRAVAPWLLVEMANRPLSLVRCPDGSEGTCFFQKHYLPTLGANVHAIKLRQKDGEHDYLYVNDVQGLLDLVQMNCLELHPWGSLVDDPELPDRIVFDLDPDEGIAWKAVVAAARDIREQLQAIGLESFVRLTGGKGLHVVAPIMRGPTWEQAKQFAETFADSLVTQRPEKYIATMSKAKRTGKIFIDWLRNSRGATSVTSWSLRARPGAPVAVPLRWEDLGRIKAANAFDLKSAARRAKGLVEDPWAPLYQLKQALPTGT